MSDPYQVIREPVAKAGTVLVRVRRSFRLKRQSKDRSLASGERRVSRRWLAAVFFASVSVTLIATLDSELVFEPSGAAIETARPVRSIQHFESLPSWLTYDGASDFASPIFKSLPKRVAANGSMVFVGSAEPVPQETRARDLTALSAGSLTASSSTVVSITVVSVKGADTHREPPEQRGALRVAPVPASVLGMLAALQLEQPSIPEIVGPSTENAATELLPELAVNAMAGRLFVDRAQPAPIPLSANLALDATAAVAYPSAQNDDLAVLAAVQNYSAAWNARDTAAIRAVRPDLQQHKLRKELADVHSIDMRIRPASNPRINGDRAAVECIHDVRETFTGGVERSAVGVRTTYTLVRRHGAWVIEDIIPH